MNVVGYTLKQRRLYETQSLRCYRQILSMNINEWAAVCFAFISILTRCKCFSPAVWENHHCDNYSWAKYIVLNTITVFMFVLNVQRPRTDIFRDMTELDCTVYWSLFYWYDYDYMFNIFLCFSIVFKVVLKYLVYVLCNFNSFTECLTFQ